MFTSNSKIESKCYHCGITFYKEKRRYYESIKRNWKIYCSKDCAHQDRKKETKVICENPACNKLFIKKLKEIKKTKASYCSQSCAAIVNNRKFPKIRACVKNCLVCHKEFTGENKCCSFNCRQIRLKSLLITNNQIIKLIKKFNKKHGRIPFKEEFKHYCAARNRFGTWNKAIIAAGFNPNPVMFARKHTAKDGHICDSLSEKIIDDFLCKNQISHQHHVPYGKNKMTADFKINSWFVEFIGLEGENQNYDKALRRKRNWIKQQNLKVKEIYPKDLFPKNKLSLILKEVL